MPLTLIIQRGATRHQASARVSPQAPAPQQRCMDELAAHEGTLWPTHRLRAYWVIPQQTEARPSR